MEKNQSLVSRHRRKFLAGSALLGGGLVVAFYAPSTAQRILKVIKWKMFPPDFTANAFVRIAPDSSITIVVNRLEMGQGVHTSMSQLIAEELACDWQSIKAISSNADPIYNTPMGMVMTGGSSSLRESWDPYRRVGAGMREMLVTTAARRWGVPEGEVRTSNGFVLHETKGKLSYGKLADEAGQLPFPKEPKLKNKAEFKVIGCEQRRVDALDKCTGRAKFGLDIRLPGMLYCVVGRPAISIAKLVSFDEQKARAISGVVDVVKFGNRIAVLAKHTFAAKQGRDALDAKWDAGEFSKVSSESLMRDFKQLAQNHGVVAKEVGKVDEVMLQAARKIEAEFEFPFLAHAAMEPINCTIDFDGNKAILYGGFQTVTLDHEAAEKVLGIPKEKIELHVTYTGGSFGRRASVDSDWVSEACKIAKIVKKPLQVVWTREDDMRGGHYRPMVYHKVVMAWTQRTF